MASVAPLPKWQVFDGTGTPLSGAKLYTFLAATSTPANTYTNYVGDTPAAWPLVFDSEGRSEVWLGTGSYKLILLNSVDSTIWSVDGVQGSGGAGSAGMQSVQKVVGASNSLRALSAGICDLVTAMGYSDSSDGGGGTFRWKSSSVLTDDGGYVIKPAASDATTSGRWFRLISGPVNPRWWGAVGDGATDDSGAFSNAKTYLTTYSPTSGFQVPAGNYSLGSLSDTTFFSTHAVNLLPNAILKWSTGSVQINAVIAQDDTSKHFDLGSIPVFPKGATVSPLWFGALGDGTNDDSTAINRAIGSLTTGGTVLFASGRTYKITSPLTLKSNVTLQGEGGGSKILADSTAFTSGSHMISHSPQSECLENVNIDSLNIVGSTSRTTGGIWLNAKNSAVKNCLITDQYKQGVAVGGMATGGADVHVTNNTLKSCGTGANGLPYPAIDVISGARHKIFGNTVKDSTAGGNSIRIYPQALSAGYADIISYVEVSENTVCSAIAYETSATTDSTDSARNIKISDNLVQNVSDTDVIKIGTLVAKYSPKGTVVVKGNTINNVKNAGTGIKIYQNAPSYAIYDSLHVVENAITTAADATAWGIDLYYCDSTGLVAGNTINSVGASGILYGIRQNGSSSKLQYGTNFGNGTTALYSGVTGKTIDIGEGFRASTDGTDGTNTVTVSTVLSSRIQEKKGASVDATSTLVLGSGNYFNVNVMGQQIKGIDSTGWQSGSVVQLYWEASGDTLVHGSTDVSPNLILSVGMNHTVEAGDMFAFRYDSDRSSWIEMKTTLSGAILTNTDSSTFIVTFPTDKDVTFSAKKYNDNSVRLNWGDKPGLDVAVNHDGTGLVPDAFRPSSGYRYLPIRIREASSGDRFWGEMRVGSDGSVRIDSTIYGASPLTDAMYAGCQWYLI